MNITEDQIRRAAKIRHLHYSQGEKELCEKSYEQFVKSAWPVLETAYTLDWNWHYSVLCDEMQGQIERIANKEPKKYDLIINIPPRSLKSMIFTRMPTPWAWIKYPGMRFMRGSYSEDFAMDHAVESRYLIESSWYQNYWGNNYQISSVQNTKHHFRTNFNGACMVTSPTSKGTGGGGDIVSIDDPISAIQAESDVFIARANKWYKRVLKSRLNNHQIGIFIIIMQRLHMEDLTGYVLEHEKGRWKIICLPARDCNWVRPIKLRKKYVNGLLFEKRWNHAYLDQLEEDDAYMYSGQFQQRPTPEEGGMFKKVNWRFWVPSGENPKDYTPVKFPVKGKEVECENVELPRIFNDFANTWDFSFEDTEKSDPVAGFAAGYNGVSTFILDRRYGQMDHQESCDALLSLHSEWPLASNTLIEKRALGHAIIQDYKKQISGVIPVEASQGLNSTHARAVVASRHQKTGNIILPHPDIHKWSLDVVEEHAAYKNHKISKNDQVVAISQVVNHFKNFHPVFPLYKRKEVEIKIDWRNLDYSIYSLFISQWVEQDSSSSIILAAYNARTRRLGVFGEFTMSTNDPRLIKPLITTIITRYTGGMVSNTDKFEWVGSPNMFGRPTTDSTKMSRAHLQREGMWDSYSRAGINLIDNMSFEIGGAILHTNQMILDKGIVFDVKASESSRQFAAWSYEGDKPSQVGYGCAMAVINIVNMLNESGKMLKIEKVIPAYSEKREKLIEKYNQADQMGTLGDLVGMKPVVPKDENSWMML